MNKQTPCYFLTVGFYNEHDEYQPRLLRGYYNKAYAQAVCDRIMKYVIDHNKWMIACEAYLNAHSELRKIPMRDNQYPQTRGRLRAEWESANPFTTAAKQHNRNYWITEAPIKLI